MANEQRLSPGHIRPFGEALPPPLIIFRDRMELRKVISNDVHLRRIPPRDDSFKSPSLNKTHPCVLADETEHTLKRMTQHAIARQRLWLKIIEIHSGPKEGPQQ